MRTVILFGRKKAAGSRFVYSVAVENSPGTIIALHPVTAFHAFDTNLSASARGVHEVVVAKIDANVREGAAHRVEEHQIARFELAGIDLLADLAHFLGGARQGGANAVLEDEADETAK